MKTSQKIGSASRSVFIQSGIFVLEPVANHAAEWQMNLLNPPLLACNVHKLAAVLMVLVYVCSY